MTEHRGRMWTPLSIAVLSVCLAAGFAFIGWCGDTAVKAISGRLDTLEQKQDRAYARIGEISIKEDADIKCVNENFRLFKGTNIC